MKYVHTNIITKDWKRLSKFYCKVFKCKIILPRRNQKGRWLDTGVGMKKAHLEGVHLRLPGHGKNGPTLEIYSYKKTVKNRKPIPNRLGFGHIAFEVKNVSAILKKLEKHGGSAFGKIAKKRVKGIGMLTFIYAKDPDGNLIEIQNWRK